MSVHFTRAHILLSLLLIIISSSGGLTEEPDGLKKVWDPTNETLTICSDSGTPYLSIQQLSTAPDLTTFTEIFNITSYVTHTLDPNEDFRATWAQFKGTSGITGVDWYIQKNESYSITVNDYGEVTNSQIIPKIIEYENITDTWTCEDGICNLGDCSSDQKWEITRTTANGTETGIVCFDRYEVLDLDPLRIKVHWTSTGIIGSHIETRYRQVWKPFSPIGKTIHPDESYIIKVMYHKKPEIGESNIQLIPMFRGLWCEELTWWNTSWSHRKAITLTGNTSGAQTNYQLLLNITYDSNMQADFDDLRFCNDTDEIDAWLESKVNSAYANVYVEFPTTPADGEEEIYHIYYGKVDAVSDWDGIATFDRYADKNDYSTHFTSNGASVDGDYISVGIAGTDSYGTNYLLAIDALDRTTQGYIVNFKLKGTGTTSNEDETIFGFATDNGLTSPQCDFYYSASNDLKYYEDGSAGSIDTVTWMVDNVYKLVYPQNTGVKYYLNGTLKRNNGAYTSDPGKVRITPYSGPVLVKHVYVRKYAANPPTYEFGSEEYYINSIHHNTTHPYNLTIDSNGNIASNRSIIAADDLNWTAQAVSDDCDFIVTEHNLSNTTIANFTVYTANLDWLQVTNLTVGATYNLTNGTTYEHQTADAIGEANFTTDLIPGDYQILRLPVTTPVITLLSQTPSALYENSTGYLNISYGISHDVYGLNNTSVSFIFRNYDHTLNDANHSIRPPANDKCAVWEYNGQIIRAANRNESLNFENNDTITGGDIYTWSGLDENQTRLTIHPINSTYTIVNISGSVHGLAMEQMWYLDRTSMIESTKTKLAIHKTQDVLIKFWDAEVFKGNYDFIGVGYTDTSLGTLHPSDANPVSFYKLNFSYDPLGGVAPLDSPYIVYMGSLNASGWVDHVCSLDGVNYVRGMINNSYVHSIMDTTEIEYLYFTSNTPSAKPYYINITNDASNTNRTFGETNVMWIGDAAPYTAHPYTPNMWFAFIYQNTSFDHKLYAAGASGLWSNSTLNRTYIGVGQFLPTKPYIDHFNYSGVFDYDMNGYYTGNFTIVGGVSTDPDGGTVTHNLTLHYANNLTLVAIINNTFTDADIIGNGVFAEIAFNSTPYLSDTVQYTLKLVATDDEGDTAETWLGVDFWLAERPPTPGFIFEIFVLMILFAAGMMMYSFLMIDLDNYTHVLAAFLSGIVYILSGFSAFSGIGFYGDDALLGIDQTGWVSMVFIVLGSIMILYACVLGLDTAKEVIEELEESTT